MKMVSNSATQQFVPPALPVSQYYWTLSHHITKLDFKNFLDVLDVIKKYDGKNISSTNNSDRINLDKELSKLLSENVRSDSGKTDVFRDYQQLYIHFGIIYPHKLVNGKLRLTPLASKLADGSISLAEFLLLQAFGYQFPNGASEPEIIRKYLQCQVMLKPILLIYQILKQLALKDAQQAYLYEDEIITFVVPQRDNNKAASITDEIIKLRNNLARPAYGVAINFPTRWPGDTEQSYRERKRTTQELTRILTLLPLFHVETVKNRKQIKIEVTKLEEIGLPELEALAIAETTNSSFFQFGDFKDLNVARLEWFNYYGSVKRLADWHTQAGNTKQIKEKIERTPPPPIVLRSFSNADDAQPIRVKATTLPRNAEQIAKIQEYRLNAHRELVKKFATKVVSSGGFVEEDSHSLDLVATFAERIYLTEMKTLLLSQSGNPEKIANEDDTISQIRHAIGQLLEYKYRFQIHKPKVDDAAIKLCIVLNRFPENEEWVINFVVYLDMLIAWWDIETQSFQYPTELKEELGFLSR